MPVSSQYPKDEFDRAGEDMPVGMHRPQPSKWRSVIPFLIVLLVVPLLGWGFSQMLTSRGVVTSQSGQTSTSQSGAPAQSPAPSEAQSGEESSPAPAEPEESPSPEETPTVAPIDHNVAIEVLNGTGVAGYAAGEAAKLNAQGFAGTTAANANGWGTAVSTVYYADPQIESSAREIARILGIEVVELNTTDLGNSDVIVILR